MGKNIYSYIIQSALRTSSLTFTTNWIEHEFYNKKTNIWTKGEEKKKEKDWSAEKYKKFFCKKFYYHSTAKMHFEFTV